MNFLVTYICERLVAIPVTDGETKQLDETLMSKKVQGLESPQPALGHRGGLWSKTVSLKQKLPPIIIFMFCRQFYHSK